MSIARELRRRHRARAMVIEKEPSPGRHASGRNSGVLHAGVYYKPGIRAQLVDTRTAELLSDFVIEPGPRSTHVLNAVSPDFTSSVPFAEYVVDMIKYAD